MGLDFDISLQSSNLSVCIMYIVGPAFVWATLKNGCLGPDLNTEAWWFQHGKAVSFLNYQIININ